MVTREELIAFEAGLAEDFNAGRIRHPIHLSDGNEDQLIGVFKGVSSGDWLCGTWRFHYQCLLAGVPAEKLRAACFRGDSIALCFPEYRVMCSAIVGGILPIAVGIAMGMKRRGSCARVHVWSGDMTAQGGQFHECVKYAANHMLNMRFIIEDNGISVCTDTARAWGKNTPGMLDGAVEIAHYHYRSRFPHAGAGVRVEF